MVKLHGPICSLDASGTFADIANYAKTGPTNWARVSKRRRDARSPAQVSVRKMFFFLNRMWGGIYYTDKWTWNPSAEAQQILPVNAYVQYNLLRWRRFLPPSEAYPPAKQDTVPPWSVPFPIATSQINRIKLALRIDPGDMLWPCCIHRADSTGFTPTRENTVDVIQVATGVAIYYYDQPLPVGTYYYRLRAATADGVWGPFSNEITADSLPP